MGYSENLINKVVYDSQEDKDENFGQCPNGEDIISLPTANDCDNGEDFPTYY
jgi:hypothetical protein